MSCVSELSQSNEYLSFRSSIPLRKIVVDSDGSKAWRIFDSGPKSVNCPLICLPPVSGTADVFFQQVLGLATRGVRVIAAEPPPYWNIKEWCDGFKRLIDYLELDKVHVFGASLGGFIAQKFAELTSNCPRVASLVLCNTFTDTSVFEYHDSSALFWLLPSLVLKRMLMGNFTTDKVDKRMAESIDFMVERLESLNQSELASRLTLNCTPCYIKPQALGNLPITVMDVWDECALSSRVREDLYKSYPQAKLAHLKSGGNFPYLSRSDEVNLHLLIHLRQFDGTDLSASYLSLHKMPAPTSFTQPEEGTQLMQKLVDTPCNLHPTLLLVWMYELTFIELGADYKLTCSHLGFQGGTDLFSDACSNIKQNMKRGTLHTRMYGKRKTFCPKILRML